MVLKVLVTDPIDEEFVEKLKGYVHVEVAPNLSGKDLIKKVHDVDILVVRSRTNVTEDVIKRAGRLRMIARAGSASTTSP